MFDDIPAAGDSMQKEENGADLDRLEEGRGECRVHCFEDVLLVHEDKLILNER